MNGSLRNKYKIAGPQTWELVRAAYLGGESAQVVAERYGVTVAAIRRRACKEKWTKRHLAEALEARGVAPPPPPAAPDYIEPQIELATQRMAAEAEANAELNALVERIAAEEDAADIASAIERRALAQASAAMVQGRSKEAQALASMAEQMRKRALAVASTPLAVQRANDGLPPKELSPQELERRAWMQAGMAMEQGKPGDAKAMAAVAEKLRKRVEDDREAERVQAEAEEVDRTQNEETGMWFFTTAAELASAMVHNPNSAPAAFLQMIKRWREINLGEGEEDAEVRAAIVAAAAKRHLDGSWVENTPEDVRQYLNARWVEARVRLGLA